MTIKSALPVPRTPPDVSSVLTRVRGYTLTQIEEAAKTYLQVTSFIKASTNNRYGKLLYSYIDLDSVEVFKELDSDTITIKYLQSSDQG